MAEKDTPGPSMKLKTARTLKWNTIDRLASQIVYAVVGVVLANILSQDDFGLVGVLLIFQAFATILTDSGFGAALLRKKDPTSTDYSTVFWFNLIVSVSIYVILWFSAPIIAKEFGDARLDGMSKVMFVAFVVNGLGIVQTNIRMKRMDVRGLALANLTGLVISGAIGVLLALRGAGAWALVWQTVSLAIVKTAILWIAGSWRPTSWISVASLKSIWRIGASVLSSSALNTLSLNLYNFVIGLWYRPLSALGIYTQADKWSKMGSASISQILTASFVPLLAGVQDNSEAFHRYLTRIGRFASFILFPVLGGMAAVGEPLFHALFGNKWDAAIPLFQILCIRGIFVVFTSLHTNYLLALGNARLLIAVEVVKDTLMIAAILCTVWSGSLTLLVWGQLWASVLTFAIVMIMTARSTAYPIGSMLADSLPFLIAAILMYAAAIATCQLPMRPILRLGIAVAAGTAAYILPLLLTRNPEFREAAAFFRRKIN